MSRNSSLERSVEALSARVSRLALNESPAPANTLAEVNRAQNSYPYSLTSGYSPKFQGIYILTEPTKKQVRLFDYTDLVTPKTRVDVVDIDQDGDRDYIFILGNTLYIKKTSTQSPTKIVDTGRSVEELGTDAPYPSAVNHFNQVLSSPSELNITFRNTIPDQREWRLEFYDRYMEWDREAIGTSTPTTAPKTVIDLFAEETTPPVVSGTDVVHTTAVARSLQSGYTDDDFRIQAGEINILTGSSHFSLPPGKTLYTGDQSTTIEYKNMSTSEEKSLRLEPYHAYQFDVPVDIQMRGGKIFIIDTGTATHTYTASPDMGGLPLLDGMTVVSGHNIVITDQLTRTNTRLEPGTLYLRQSLGPVATEYNFNIPYPNGYYYARLKNLNPRYTDRVGVVLLSPQASSDRTSPVSSLSDIIRIPVYVTQSVSLADSVTELSDFVIRFDDDTTTDANNNGVFDDDFVESSPRVRQENGQLIFGPFDTPGKYPMMIELTDEWGNNIVEELTVEAYTPVPQIAEVTPERLLTGALGEPIAAEPIHFWRIRSGEQPRLIQTGAVETGPDGQFHLDAADAHAETVELNNFAIQPRNLASGLPAGYSTDITPANAANPMLIGIKNASGALIYQQMLTLPQNAQIGDADLGRIRLTGGQQQHQGEQQAAGGQGEGLHLAFSRESSTGEQLSQGRRN